MQVAPFETRHVDPAATLLVERLRRERREGQPWHGASLETPEVLAGLVAGAAQSTQGYACLNGDNLIAFIQVTERSERPWVPSTWIGYTGHAAADPNAYRYLYAAAAQAWVEAGRLDHYATVPALDDVVWAFFALGFGLEQVYGIRSLESVEFRSHPSAEIRLATPDDFDALKDLFGVLPAYQQAAPTFGLNTIGTEELAEGHAELLADDKVHYWIAISGGRAVGFMIFDPVEDPEAPYYPPTTISLDVAAVADDARGAGIGSALTAAGLQHAAEAGFTHCITDWRSPNLTSGPTWTRWGFVPYAYRVHRTVDSRLGPR